MNYVDQIAAAIQSQYPSLTEVIGIGRQNEDGVIVIGSETYGGISDKRDNYAYIRYRGREDWRHSRATRQISSTPTMEATAELRLVVVHREQDTASFVEGLAGVLMGVFKNVGGVHIQVQSTDQDRNRILREESKTDNGQWNTSVGLARVDFTLTYTYTGQPCNPADLCGGGTLPTPTDCPTLCDQITVATAEQVVDCFDPVKEAAVKELICDPCPPIPTLCDQIEEATVIEIIECLSPSQEDGIKAALCDPCLPATYTNGAAFTQVIAGGETYTAPQVTMTAVDGTTEDIPANIDYTCEWKVVNVRSTDGVFTATVLTAYPTDGNSDVLAYRFRNSDNGFFANVPARNNVRLVNADFALIENDTPTPATTNLTIEVNVPVVNSNGDSVGGNVTSLLTPHELPQLPVTDSDGAVGSYPMPTALAVVGQVNSATYSGGTLTITPAGGAAGGIAPMPVFATQVNLFGETGFVEGAQIAAGIFDPPTGPFSNCQGLDYAAASPFITLKHAHLGGTARWRDSSNNALAYGDATVADGLVTDLGFDRQWYIVRQSAANFQAALDAAAAATYGGHTDWRLPTRSELWTLFDLNNTDVINTIPGRPPGFDANSTNSVVSCTTAELSSILVYGTFGTNRRTQFFIKANSVFYILVRNFGSY